MARRKGHCCFHRFHSCPSPSRRLVFVSICCCFCCYIYIWRHYLALVFQPPSAANSSFNPHQHEERLETHAELQYQLLESLPKWIQDYTKWHARVKRGAPQTRILLVSIEQAHSGGLADRLRSLPFFLWEAAQSQRLLLIQWKNPCPMEEFLVPPIAGIDWTVPTILNQESAVWYRYNDHNNKLLADNEAFQNVSLIKTVHTPWTFTEGMPLMAKQALNVSSMLDPIFAHIFKLLLTPSPPVQEFLESTMTSLQLLSKEYNGVHLRARYPGFLKEAKRKSFFARSVDADGFAWTRDAENQVKSVVNRAISCLNDVTTNNNSFTPIYFASDTNDAVRFVSQSYENVIGMVTPYEKFHLDRNDKIGLIRKTPPSAFYPAIVDLLILSRAKCLVAGNGGYGIFAAMIGGIGDCLWLYSDNSFVSGSTGSDAMMCPTNGEDTT